MIPFFVGYYKKTVSDWLGNRRLIFFVLAIILSDLVLANALMYTAIWMKIVLTLLTATSLFLFYRRNRLNELV